MLKVSYYLVKVYVLYPNVKWIFFVAYFASLVI